MFGNALMTVSMIVGISSFVSEWLVFLEVSQASNGGGTVDGGSLRGLFWRSPSVPRLPNVVSLVPAG